MASDSILKDETYETQLAARALATCMVLIEIKIDLDRTFRYSDRMWAEMVNNVNSNMYGNNNNFIVNASFLTFALAIFKKYLTDRLYLVQRDYSAAGKNIPGVGDWKARGGFEIAFPPILVVAAPRGGGSRHQKAKVKESVLETADSIEDKIKALYKELMSHIGRPLTNEEEAFSVLIFKQIIIVLTMTTIIL
jgi:hypothetical protein